MGVQSQISRIQYGKNAIIAALNSIGLSIPEGTTIDNIAPYIRSLGVFRGTMETYENAYNAGLIAEGTIVIIDGADTDETTAVLGKAILGKMILGKG
jgi:hypothetical protein